ncbi:MAG: ABC transporter ATP-binding protein [Bdellovibrionales bacterium]|nr:ABC transporter ATP-binding protein [Bdellovibrionales bacterium]
MSLTQSITSDGAPGSILLERVSKRFRKRTLMRKNYTTVKGQLLERLLGPSDKDSGMFTALDTITVKVKPGCSLGVIGRNGSGKSTLLKLVSGIYRPDSGSVSVNGRISALIELGAGFHPEFSGRENVYLGGVMYGLSRKEIDARFDDIVRYAELEDYIDDPVKTYSSGMYMRLGFSLAVHTDPDILLIDEVLAVGDAGFIHRCHDTISDFRRRGKTLLFVTHDLSSVERWCDEAIWLDKGVVRGRGEPRRVIDLYMQTVNEAEEEKLLRENEAAADAAPTSPQEISDNTAAQDDDDEREIRDPEREDGPGRWGNGEVEITDVKFLSKSGEKKWLFSSEDEAVIEVDYTINRPVKELAFGIGILRVDGVAVFGTNTGLESVEVPLPDFSVPVQGGFKGTYRFHIERMGLLESTYYLDVAAHKSDHTPYDYHHRMYKFSIRCTVPFHGVFNPKHSWSFDVSYATEGKTTRLEGTC